MRIEPQHDQTNGTAIMIWNTAAHQYFVLMPERHVYLELGSPMMQQAVTFWRPVDVNNACPDWEKLAAQLKTTEKMGSCKRVGDDAVNGRAAVKYEGTSADGKKSEVWLDSKLRYLIKVKDAEGDGMEFRNIHEGALAGSLFEIPPGYQKMDMGSMTNRRAPSH